jgi:hypothetical protein
MYYDENMTKRYQTIAIIGLFLLLGFTHPIHLSITTIDMNDANKSLEITHRFFVDDFEKRIEDEYQVKLFLGTAHEHPQSDAYIQRFLAQNFSIIINEKEVERIFIGKEIASEAIWVYVEIPKVKKVKSALVKNSVLFDTFEDQRNFINFKHSEGKKSLILSAQNPQVIVYFNE